MIYGKHKVYGIFKFGKFLLTGTAKKQNKWHNQENNGGVGTKGGLHSYSRAPKIKCRYFDMLSKPYFNINNDKSNLGHFDICIDLGHFDICIDNISKVFISILTEKLRYIYI